MTAIVRLNDLGLLMPTGKKKFLFVIDDGWRYERRDALRYLKDNGVEFEIVTHVDSSYEHLKENFNVRKIQRHPRRGGLVYKLVLFFARELDTHLNRTMRRIRQ